MRDRELQRAAAGGLGPVGGSADRADPQPS
jgi:hypothetical protein